MYPKVDQSSSPIRKRYDNHFKMRIVDKFAKTNKSVEKFSEKYGISPSMIYDWKSKAEVISTSTPYGEKIDMIHKSYYSNIEDDLYGAILDERSEGRAVNYMWIQDKAHEINNGKDESEKVTDAKFVKSWVNKFLKRFDLTVRKKSSSRNPSIPYGSVIEAFQNEIKQIVLNYQIKKCNIFNMDETGIFLDMSPDYTIEKLGTKSVSIVSNSAAKQRFTCVLTIRADGTRLNPLIIFKGVNRPRNLPVSDDICSVEVQKNAWMNVELMHKYVENLPTDDEDKLLIMDAFTVHKNQEILRQLESKKYHVVFVPPGYTDVMQPLDVSIMHSFKSAMRIEFRNWLPTVPKVNGRQPIPSKSILIQWVSRSFTQISNEIIEGAFPAANIEIPMLDEDYRANNSFSDYSSTSDISYGDDNNENPFL